METLSLNQALPLTDVSPSRPKAQVRYSFSATRWLLGAAFVAIAALAVSQISVAQDFVSAFYLEIEQLQQLLQDPNRWLQ